MISLIFRFENLTAKLMNHVLTFTRKINPTMKSLKFAQDFTLFVAATQQV